MKGDEERLLRCCMVLIYILVLEPTWIPLRSYLLNFYYKHEEI